MRPKPHFSILYVVAILGTILGFRLVTQSGLRGSEGLTQNDGYAFCGGLLLLLSGALGYYSMARIPKSPKMKELKKASDDSYAELMKSAKEMKKRKK